MKLPIRLLVFLVSRESVITKPDRPIKYAQKVFMDKPPAVTPSKKTYKTRNAQGITDFYDRSLT